MVMETVEAKPPVIGRIVRLYIHDQNGLVVEECPGIIVKVHSDTCINLTGFRDNGNASPFTSIERARPDKESFGTTWEYPSY